MITATENAIARIAYMIEQRNKGLGIRIGVKTTGCSGLAYVLEYLDEIDNADHVFELSNGIKLAIDPKSLAYVDGTEIDYVKHGLNEGFEFNNPNVRSECGCGESFNV